MKKLEVELGLQLDKPLKYYEKMLKKNGYINTCNHKVKDIYFTKSNLDGLSENEIKNSCVRLRYVKNDKLFHKWHGKFQNLKLLDPKLNDCEYDSEIIKKLLESGFRKVFRLEKLDRHYVIDGCNGDIQFQPAKGFGLLMFYYNPDYFGKSLDEQRKLLIDELNKVGFNFNYDVLGVDRLRSLNKNEICYSKNQVG